MLAPADSPVREEFKLGTGAVLFDDNADANPAGTPRHPANPRSTDGTRKRRK
jgi:hypothetical protein